MPAPKKEELEAKQPDFTVGRVSGKPSDAPVIGKAGNYKPATYQTKRKNVREDR